MHAEVGALPGAGESAIVRGTVELDLPSSGPATSSVLCTKQSTTKRFV